MWPVTCRNAPKNHIGQWGIWSSWASSIFIELTRMNCRYSHQQVRLLWLLSYLYSFYCLRLSYALAKTSSAVIQEWRKWTHILVLILISVDMSQILYLVRYWLLTCYILSLLCWSVSPASLDSLGLWSWWNIRFCQRDFCASNKMIMLFLFLSLFMEYIMFIDLHVLILPWISQTKLTWS